MDCFSLSGWLDAYAATPAANATTTSGMMKRDFPTRPFWRGSVFRYRRGMPITTGFNHVATLTTDMDLTVGFYERAFDATVTFTMQKTDDHPYMKIVELGG